MFTVKKQWVGFVEERLAKGKSVFYDVIDVMTPDCEELEFLVHSPILYCHIQNNRSLTGNNFAYEYYIYYIAYILSDPNFSS